VSCLLYIDDRLIEEFNGYLPPQIDNSTTRAKIAIHLAVKLFVSLGYFLNIAKSVLEPVQSLVFLGMIIDTEKMSFFLTEKRKEKLKNVRQMILQSKKVPVAVIQKFTGLCISMCLAIPGAKLYTSVCNQAISNATVNCSDIIIDEKLREEVQFWECLDLWDKPFPWVSDRHFTLKVTSDSSDYKWAGTISGPNLDRVISDYWNESIMSAPIMIKEALALKKLVVKCFRCYL